MGLGNLFIAASMPVLKLLIVTGVGSFLATKRAGILDGDALKHLNNMVFYVFDPAFVYINLAKTITLKSMISLWFMPINILLTFVIGTILGWVLIQITKPPAKLRGLILGCCAGGNLGNMLVVIAPAVCKEKSSPFGAQDICNKYGLLYASLSMAIGSVFLWSYVYNMLRISSFGGMNKGTNNLGIGGTSISDGTLATIPETQVSTQDSGTGGTSISDGTLATLPETQVSTQDSVDYGQLEDQRRASSPKLGELNENPKVLISSRFGKILSTVSANIDLKKLLAPSTIAVIIGYFVGVISPIRKIFVGESAPLRVIQSSVAILGDGDIAATILVMGGNLTRGIRKSGIRASLIIGIIIVRYIALPLLGVLVVKGAIHFGLVQRDPLYQFILLLQFTLPPAMSIGIMTQLFGSGQSECSMVFLWTYALAIPSLTLWSAFFMWLVS